MGFNNPGIPWREFERRLSWGSRPPASEPTPEPAVPPVRLPRRTGGWAELHCHSSYSFLDGATTPEDHEARMEVWEDDLRKEWEDRGHAAGLQQGRREGRDLAFQEIQFVLRRSVGR